MTTKPRTIRPRLSTWFLTEDTPPTISGVYAVHLLEKLAGVQVAYTDIRYYRKFDAETGHWSGAFVTLEIAALADTDPSFSPPIVWCGLAENPNPVLTVLRSQQ